MKGQPVPVKATRAGPRRYFILALILAAIPIAIWLLLPADPPHDTPAVAEVKATSHRRTVAQSWQWQPTAKSPDKPAVNTPIGRISPGAVVRALGRVEFDENGKVVVDRKARDLLEDSLETLSNLTAEELDALQKTIRVGLPGPQGERVAKIVSDYYRYRAALQDFERSADAPTTPDGERTRLNYLAKLRDEHLGPVVARQFYAEDQALQRYLLESKGARGAEGATQQKELQKELQDGVFYLDSRTSPEAKELGRQMELLRKQGVSDGYSQYIQAQQLGLYTANVLPRTDTERSDWQQRYAQFKQERQFVLTAGLTEEDKKSQIEQLLRQYFKSEELEAIGTYSAR